MRRIAFLALAAFALAGCASDEPKNRPEGGRDEAGSPRPEVSLPPLLTHPLSTRPLAGALPVIPKSAPRELSLIPGDLVSITVYRQPDLSIEVRIPQGGTFRYPLIGQVSTTGCPISELENDIRLRLDKDYLKDPQVTVMVKEHAPRKIYVLGGVVRPSGYEVLPTERVTLMQLIASAGRHHRQGVQGVRAGREARAA